MSHGSSWTPVLTFSDNVKRLDERTVVQGPSKPCLWHALLTVHVSNCSCHQPTTHQIHAQAEWPCSAISPAVTTSRCRTRGLSPCMMVCVCGVCSPCLCTLCSQHSASIWPCGVCMLTTVCAFAVGDLPVRKVCCVVSMGSCVLQSSLWSILLPEPVGEA